MIRSLLSLLLVLGLVFFVASCEQDDISTNDAVPTEVIDQLRHLGFNPDGIRKMDDGYLIENDILITEEFLSSELKETTVPQLEQFSTFNQVNPANYAGGVIKIYIDAPGAPAGNSTATGSGNPGQARGGKPGGGGGGGGTQFSQDYADALDDAMARYNSENLSLSFERTADPAAADITFTRLKKGDERQGILGSAGFPTSGGAIYNEIKMSGIVISNFGWSVDALATVMAHEMGHCIGFRHTDYYNRSISCGSGGNEGQATSGIGAEHIPGTPNVGQVSASDKSWMLSCTGNESRPFNSSDKVALDFLY